MSVCVLMIHNELSIVAYWWEEVFYVVWLIISNRYCLGWLNDTEDTRLFEDKQREV